MKTYTNPSDGTTHTWLEGWYSSGFVTNDNSVGGCGPTGIEVASAGIGVWPRNVNELLSLSVTRPKAEYVGLNPPNPQHKHGYPINSTTVGCTTYRQVKYATNIEAPDSSLGLLYVPCGQSDPTSSWFLPGLNYTIQYATPGRKLIRVTTYLCDIDAQTGEVASDDTFEFDVVTPPTLSLFLDVDGINLADPFATDDLNWYRPCSLSNGQSVPFAQLPQALTVVAAYVGNGGTGAIVAPPTTGNATLTLSDVSAFRGVAMNATIAFRENLPDFEVATVSASFGANNTARFSVTCWDYGGFAKATVTHGSGATLASATMALPDDPGFNWVPDIGWPVPRAGGGFDYVVDNLMTPDDDVDDVPSANGFNGDGLSRFEEYRGFVVKGIHTRTDPSKKDLFIYSDYSVEGVGDAQTLPVVVHQINASEMSSPQQRLIAPNHQNAGYPSMNIPGHFVGTFSPGGQLWQTSEQRAIGVFRNTSVLDINAGFGVTNIPSTVLGAPPWAVGPFGSTVHDSVIHKLSPTRTGANQVDNPLDSEKTRQTIAHEVGHASNIPHIQKNPAYSCPPPADTVMIIGYFPTTNPRNSPSCAWSNVPHAYTPADLSQLQIR